ncbi:MAG: hypothetical protein JRH11_11695 [Deltaproteobacteria bacterium]|nr:hypothetical protein [Deltaproteobacteria bacterium]
MHEPHPGGGEHAPASASRSPRRRLECQTAAFDHTVECIRDLGCTAAAFDSCSNLEERLAACPDFPTIVTADLDACFDGG